MTLKVSNSRIKTWRRCKFAHYCKYVLNIERRRPAKPLIKGKMIHSLVEAIIMGKSLKETLAPYKEEYGKLFLEEQEEYGNILSDVHRIMLTYKKKYKKDGLTYIKYNKKLAEHDITVPLTSDIELRFIIDAIAKANSSKNRLWLKETKSFTKLPKEEVRFTDLQTALYAWGWEQLGNEPIYGILWDYIRSKPPVTPDLLKNGSLSKRKNIDSTYEVYLETIHEYGLDPAHYQDILEDLRNKPDSFFRRIFLPAPKNITDTLIKDFIESSYEIYHMGDIAMARNITRDCSWCEYYLYCQADLRGLDVDFILKTEYRERGEEDGSEKAEEDSE